MTETTQNLSVIFVGGAGHSGSTLLGFILGSRTESLYVGEAKNVKFLNDFETEIRKRTCKICGETCELWSDFNYNNQQGLYQQLFPRTPKTTIVDSTKDTNWIRKQIELLEPTVSPYFVYIQRDGRALINSMLRKYPEKTTEQVIREWKKQVKATEKLFNELTIPKIRVHYEQLALNPETEIRKLCDFLKVDYQAQMLRWQEQEHHPLGGNTGTQFLVAKVHGEKMQNPNSLLSSRNEYYYQNHSDGIELDLRWKHELSHHVLELFEKVGGEMNQPFRYEV